MNEKMRASFCTGLLEAADECLATLVMHMREADADYEKVRDMQGHTYALLRDWRSKLDG